MKVGDYLFVSKFSYGYSRYSFLRDHSVQRPGAAGEPERGDVVVFRQPKNESVAFIKRVVGLPGDEIAVRRGILHINGTPVIRRHSDEGTATDGISVRKFDEYVETLPEGTEHSIREMTDAGILDNTPVFVVPEGHFFMMGDNRDNSNDSRTSSVGMVPSENLIGKAQFLFFSHNGSALVAGLEVALRYSIRPYRGWHYLTGTGRRTTPLPLSKPGSGMFFPTGGFLSTR